MNPFSVAVVIAVCLICGLVAVARRRRRRFLVANAPRVIEVSLERARAKQREHDRKAHEPGPEGRPPPQ